MHAGYIRGTGEEQKERGGRDGAVEGGLPPMPMRSSNYEFLDYVSLAPKCGNHGTALQFGAPSLCTSSFAVSCDPCGVRAMWKMGMKAM